MYACVCICIYIYIYIYTYMYTCIYGIALSGCTPNLPAKIIPTKIARLKTSGQLPIGLRIPPLKSKIPPESHPPKSRICVWRLPTANIHTNTPII